MAKDQERKIHELNEKMRIFFSKNKKAFEKIKREKSIIVDFS